MLLFWLSFECRAGEGGREGPGGKGCLGPFLAEARVEQERQGEARGGRGILALFWLKRGCGAGEAGRGPFLCFDSSRRLSLSQLRPRQEDRVQCSTRQHLPNWEIGKRGSTFVRNIFFQLYFVFVFFKVKFVPQTPHAAPGAPSPTQLNPTLP